MADGRGMLLVSAFLVAFPAAVVSRDAVAADGGQTFQACVPKRTRVLRLLDDGKSCRRRETTIEWSVQGPTGPTGPVGPTGATGGGGGVGGPEPGLGNAFATAKQNLQIPLPPNGDLQVLATFDLPAGSYLLQASASIGPATRLGTSVGVCLFQTMTSGQIAGFIDWNVDSNSTQSQTAAVVGAATLTSDGSVQFACASLGGPATTLHSFGFTAFQVGTLTIQ